MSTGEAAFPQRMQQVEALLQEVEHFTDPSARETTRAVVQALMDLHAAGLGALLDLVKQGGSGEALLEAFARDDLVANLLLLYGLHPVRMEERVRSGLEKVKPLLHGHGIGVELVSTAEGVVRLCLTGDCEKCPASVRTALEEAVYAAAPDLTALEVEAGARGAPRLFPLPLVGGRLS